MGQGHMVSHELFCRDHSKPWESVSVVIVISQMPGLHIFVKTTFPFTSLEPFNPPSHPHLPAPGRKEGDFQ